MKIIRLISIVTVLCVFSSCHSSLTDMVIPTGPFPKIRYGILENYYIPEPVPIVAGSDADVKFEAPFLDYKTKLEEFPGSVFYDCGEVGFDDNNRLMYYYYRIARPDGRGIYTLHTFIGCVNITNGARTQVAHLTQTIVVDTTPIGGEEFDAGEVPFDQTYDQSYRTELGVAAQRAALAATNARREADTAKAEAADIIQHAMDLYMAAYGAMNNAHARTLEPGTPEEKTQRNQNLVDAATAADEAYKHYAKINPESTEFDPAYAAQVQADADNRAADLSAAADELEALAKAAQSEYEKAREQGELAGLPRQEMEIDFEVDAVIETPGSDVLYIESTELADFFVKLMDTGDLFVMMHNSFAIYRYGFETKNGKTQPTFRIIYQGDTNSAKQEHKMQYTITNETKKADWSEVPFDKGIYEKAGWSIRLEDVAPVYVTPQDEFPIKSTFRESNHYFKKGDPIPSFSEYEGTYNTGAVTDIIFLYSFTPPASSEGDESEPEKADMAREEMEDMDETETSDNEKLTEEFGKDRPFYVTMQYRREVKISYKLSVNRSYASPAGWYHSDRGMYTVEWTLDSPAVYRRFFIHDVDTDLVDSNYWKWLGSYRTYPLSNPDKDVYMKLNPLGKKEPQLPQIQMIPVGNKVDYGFYLFAHPRGIMIYDGHSGLSRKVQDSKFVYDYDVDGRCYYTDTFQFNRGVLYRSAIEYYQKDKKTHTRKLSFVFMRGDDESGNGVTVLFPIVNMDRGQLSRLHEAKMNLPSILSTLNAAVRNEYNSYVSFIRVSSQSDADTLTKYFVNAAKKAITNRDKAVATSFSDFLVPRYNSSDLKTTDENALHVSQRINPALSDSSFLQHGHTVLMDAIHMAGGLEDIEIYWPPPEPDEEPEEDEETEQVNFDEMTEEEQEAYINMLMEQLLERLREEEAEREANGEEEEDLSSELAPDPDFEPPRQPTYQDYVNARQLEWENAEFTNFSFMETAYWELGPMGMGAIFPIKNLLDARVARLDKNGSGIALHATLENGLEIYRHIQMNVTVSIKDDWYAKKTTTTKVDSRNANQFILGYRFDGAYYNAYNTSIAGIDCVLLGYTKPNRQALAVDTDLRDANVIGVKLGANNPIEHEWARN
ncbi:MAG: hypothetical protein FWH02_04655 [Oscillospiraceae bacterium]|nr:hypothetical protein [Oscillospiraceae bacterium]